MKEDIIGQIVNGFRINKFSHKDRSGNYYYDVICMQCNRPKTISRNHSISGKASCQCSRGNAAKNANLEVDTEDLSQIIKKHLEQLNGSIYTILAILNEHLTSHPQSKAYRLINEEEYKQIMFLKSVF